MVITLISKRDFPRVKFMGHYIFCDKYNCLCTQQNKSRLENLSTYVPEMILNSIYDNKLKIRGGSLETTVTRPFFICRVKTGAQIFQTTTFFK